MDERQFLNDLIAQSEENDELEYLYFWGHTPKQSNIVDKSCLSQWFPASFSIQGIEYFTAEHCMMAQKAKLFNDEAVFMQIKKLKNPKDVKQLGRKIANYDDQVWQTKRFDIVVQANLAKFSQNAQLLKFLLETHNCILVEASPVDRIWGIGMTQDCKEISNPKQWKGLNLLGFALMQVRTLLRNSHV